MSKLIHYFAAAVVAVALAASSAQAANGQAGSTAQWLDDGVPAYSGYGQFPSSGPYGQWSPSMGQPSIGMGNSPYSGGWNGGQYPNVIRGSFQGQWSSRQGCRHGACRQNSFNGSGSMYNLGYPGSNFGVSPFSQGINPSYNPNYNPSFQGLSPGFNPASNFPPPAYQGLGQGSGHSNSSYGAPNPSFNQQPAPFNPQPNPYNQLNNSYNNNQPLNTYGPVQPDYGQSGFGQPGSNYNSQGPGFVNPQSSPFYE